MFKYLARLMMMSKQAVVTKNDKSSKRRSPPSGGDLGNKVNIGSVDMCTDTGPLGTTQIGEGGHEQNNSQTITLQVSQLLELLKLKMGYSEEGDQPEEIDDWKFTALVIDRVCVVFFGGLQICCSIVMALFTFKNFAALKY